MRGEVSLCDQVAWPADSGRHLILANTWCLHRVWVIDPPYVDEEIFAPRKVDITLYGKGNSEFKLPWRVAGSLHHLDDRVDSDQLVVDRELSLCTTKLG